MNSTIVIILIAIALLVLAVIAFLVIRRQLRRSMVGIARDPDAAGFVKARLGSQFFRDLSKFVLRS